MFACASPWLRNPRFWSATVSPRVWSDCVSALSASVRFRRRHILLRFCYLGWDYQGLASQEDTAQTIEAELFRCLLLTRLVRDRQTANYHRCGRTDKVRPALSTPHKHSKITSHHTLRRSHMSFEKKTRVAYLSPHPVFEQRPSAVAKVSKTPVRSRVCKLPSCV